MAGAPHRSSVDLVKLPRTFALLAPLALGATPTVPVAATRTSLTINLAVADSCMINSQPPAAVSVQCRAASPSRISRGAAIPALPAQVEDAAISAHQQIVTVEF